MKYTIEIYSDTCCPWCYLGKKSLDQATEKYREAHPDAQFVLTWRPFYLRMPAGPSGAGMKDQFARAILQAHGPEAAATVLSRLASASAKMGVEINWNGKSASTRDSHKLMLLARDRDRTQIDEAESRATRAKELVDGSGPEATPESRGSPEGFQARLLEALYTGIFRDGRDLSDKEYLLETAGAVGLADPEDVEEWLDGDAAGHHVDAEAARARQIGILAVPAYVVQGHYRIGGFQEPAVFTDLFEKLRTEENKGAGHA